MAEVFKNRITEDIWV